MFKKYAVLFSYSNLQNFQASGPISTASPHLFACRNPAPQQQRRAYAIVSGPEDHSKHNHGGHHWPEVTSANTIPTPYQIFNQRKGTPYSKQRFYELVKLYHPDRHDLDVSHGDLPYTAKLERYRLVVAANNILSDPVRRDAYDLYGAGWNGQPEVARDSSDAWGGGRGWGNGPNGPSQNATWEDWERWYSRDSDGPQEPRYVSNGAFVGLIVIFAALGGIGQATRVGNFSISFIEQRDALHNDISKDLMRRRRETTDHYSSREERINNFLRQRDPFGHGTMDARDEGYRKLLPAPEVCSSDDIKGRRTTIYQPRSDSKGG
jgi:curved DNA-binding protein CbpA